LLQEKKKLVTAWGGAAPSRSGNNKRDRKGTTGQRKEKESLVERQSTINGKPLAGEKVKGSGEGKRTAGDSKEGGGK